MHWYMQQSRHCRTCWVARSLISQMPLTMPGRWLERKIKQQRSDISKLSKMARRIITNNHQWLRRKLGGSWDSQTTFGCSCKRLKKYTKEAESRYINRLLLKCLEDLLHAKRWQQMVSNRSHPRGKQRCSGKLYGKKMRYNDQAEWLKDLRDHHAGFPVAIDNIWRRPQIKGEKD